MERQGEIEGGKCHSETLSLQRTSSERDMSMCLLDMAVQHFLHKSHQYSAGPILKLYQLVGASEPEERMDFYLSRV